MAGVKALVALAFSGSVGLLFLFLSCALPQFNNWYPFTVVVFYLLSPIPSIIASRYTDASGENGQCRELAWFLTTGIVISAFALPIVLTRAPVTAIPPNSTVTDVEGIISGGACGLVLTANAVMFLTILGFFLAFDNDDHRYSVW
ncbi:leptin receptor gene-related protein isoform X2 [Eurytemora carolleeae]|nr:leptin receptor gene-related protein isoform X2 [Eurytemora carolleeae]|eukprot:XP_023346089.1 leptin receptor gene-related protein-like isoform X2 [Eurytemora affinis]